MRGKVFAQFYLRKKSQGREREKKTIPFLLNEGKPRPVAGYRDKLSPPR